MRRKSKNTFVINSRQIIIFLICVLLLGTSWEAVLHTTYLDEISIVLLIGMLLVSKCGFDRNVWIPLMLHSFLALIGLLSGYGEVIDLIDAFKPLTMFAVIYSVYLDDDERSFLISFFKVINTISIIIGMMNYISFNILGTNLVINTGTYKWSNGRYMHRMAGFMSHSGFMAETCCALMIISLFQWNKQKKRFKWFEIIFYFIGVYCTLGRIALAGSFFALLFWFFLQLQKKVGKKLGVFVIVMTALAALLLVEPIGQYVLYEFNTDFEYQIRFVAIRRIMELFEGNVFAVLKQLLLGYGTGYLTTWYESHFAITLLNYGFLGILAWYIPFIYVGIKMWNSHSRYKVSSLFLLLYYLLNTLVNKSYTLPLLPITCVMCFWADKRENTSVSLEKKGSS